jgi:hypothetical protein
VTSPTPATHDAPVGAPRGNPQPTKQPEPLPHEQALLFVLVRLRSGTDRGAYQRFTAQVDRPGVLQHYRSVRSWHLHRVVDGGGLPYYYIEVAAIGDVDQLLRDMSTPAAAELMRQAREYIEEPHVLLTRRVV